jgi:hypothetical protein
MEVTYKTKRQGFFLEKTSNCVVELKNNPLDFSGTQLLYFIYKIKCFGLRGIYSGFGGLVVSMLASGTFGGLVVSMLASGTFGGLVVSMLASGTQDRGFAPGRSRRIFRAKKSSACFSSEGKQSRLPHVADLWRVKEPYSVPWKSQIIG